MEDTTRWDPAGDAGDDADTALASVLDTVRELTLDGLVPERAPEVARLLAEGCSRKDVQRATGLTGGEVGAVVAALREHLWT